MGKTCSIQCKTKQGGAALLEAMVGILIFSLAVLGVVAMFAASIKYAFDARARTEAALLVDEYIGRMRVANPATRNVDFASGGTEYSNWFNNRVNIAGRGLPQPAVDNLAIVTTTANTTVSLTLSWDTPGSNLPRATHRTVAVLN